MIKVESLRIDYEDVCAVNDLSLKIKAGQIYGLVGPNGAGKTSTIKALAGIIEPTYGEIKIADLDLELQHHEALQQIGYMPDFPPVYENLKIWEYLDVFAAAYKINRKMRTDMVEYWLEKVGLTEKRNTLVRDLSRGMRQRLILAKTLLHDPKILLLDEPASGLDPLARKEMRDLLKSVASEDKTVLVSSHILSELSDFCNSIGIMEKGSLIISGSIDEINAKIGNKEKLIIKLSDKQHEIVQKCIKFLKNSQHVSNVLDLATGEIQSNFNGSEEDASFLLSHIIKNDIPVSEFFIKTDTVEDIFFKVGAKKVS